MRLLIVEDNEELGQLLTTNLQNSGYDADVVSTLEEARIVLLTRHYAALVLDLGLPDGDALSLVKSLRTDKNAVPILILTARDGIGDRVKGLRAGADDYLVKPFAIEELIARLQALLRRYPRGSEKSQKIGNIELVLDHDVSHVLVGGRIQILSQRDLSILEVLLERPGRVVSKTLMAERIAKAGSDVTPNAIEVYVHRLRKSLDERGADVSIETIKGLGYVLKTLDGNGSA